MSYNNNLYQCDCRYIFQTVYEYLYNSYTFVFATVLHQFPMIQSNQTVGSPLITFTDTKSDTHPSICQTGMYSHFSSFVV